MNTDEITRIAHESARINAERWVDMFGRVFDDAAPYVAFDSVHRGVMEERAGRALSDGELRAIWPAYRDMMIAETAERLTAE